MPETTPNGAPYPLPSDPNDVPGYLRQLAEWADENLAAGAELNDATVTALANNPESAFAQQQKASTESLVTDPDGPVVAYNDERYPPRTTVEEQTLAARRPRFVRPQEVVLSNFASGHGWSPTSGGNGGQSGTWNLNDTSQRGRADQVVSVVTDGTGGSGATSARIERAIPVTFDPAGKIFVLLVKAVDLAKVNVVQLTLGSSAGFSNATNFTALPNSGNSVDSGEWAEVAFGPSSVAGTGAGTAPTHMRITVTDRGSAAPAAVALGGLSYYTPAKFTTGLVTICLDDTYASHFTTCRTILNKYRYKPSMFPIISNVNPTIEGQIIRAYNEDGWDIGMHAQSSAVHNATYPALTLTEVEADMQANKRWLIDRGLRSESMAYPGGSSTVAVRNLGAKYSQYGRSTFGTFETFPPSRPLGLRSVSVLNTTTLATVKARVDEAKARGQWLILTFHDIVTNAGSTYQWAAADFEALIDYINAQAVPCLSMADAGAALAA